MAIDRGIIDQQLQALGEDSSWWEQRELRDLPIVLHDGEQILALARGRLARRDVMRRRWLIVVTDQRLLSLRSSGGVGWRQVEVKAGNIGRTVLRIGPVRARISIFTTGRTHRLWVPRPDGYKLMRALSTVGSPARDVRTGFRPTLMVRRVIDHVLELPAAALRPEETQPALPPPSDVDDRMQALEHEVDELRQQVRFLEQLLQERHAAAGVPTIGSD